MKSSVQSRPQTRSPGSQDSGIQEGAGQGHRRGFSEAPVRCDRTFPAFSALPHPPPAAVSASLHSTHPTQSFPHLSVTLVTAQALEPACFSKQLRDWPLSFPRETNMASASGPPSRRSTQRPALQLPFVVPGPQDRPEPKLFPPRLARPQACQPYPRLASFPEEGAGETQPFSLQSASCPRRCWCRWGYPHPSLPPF